MSATYIGYTSEINSETSFEQNKENLITYTQKKLLRKDQSVTTPSISSSVNIGGNNLKLVGFSVTSSGSSFIEITETYQGNGETQTLQQDVTNASGEEPIETNYNFLTSHDSSPSIVNIAGGVLTEGNSINATTGGAVFSTDGKFLYFNKNAKYKLFGVSSYLNPNTTYRRTFTTQTKPDLSTVGRIVTPSSDFPSIQSPRTWLCTGIQYVKRGNTYEVTHDFRASDRKGWNTYIYGAQTSAPSIA